MCKNIQAKIKSNTINVAIIASSELPIPNLKGGAIQTLTTYLLDQNELHNDFIFDVYEYENDGLREARERYRYTHFSGYVPSGISYYYDLFWRVMNKVSFRNINRHTSFMRWVNKEIRGKEYDYILVEGQSYQVLELKTKTKIILHLHTDLVNCEIQSSDRIIRNCYAIIPVSEFLAERVRNVGCSFHSYISVLRNTIDKRKFYYSKDCRYEMRKKLNIPDNVFLGVYCGRISEEKGVYELVRALNLVDNPNIQVILIGASWFSGSKIDEYGSGIQKYIQENDLNVHMEGYIENDRLFQYFSAGDFLVFPSICNEAAGLSILEAMACGLPVIASEKGGIPEYADMNLTKLIPWNDDKDIFVEKLAEKIEEIYDERDEWGQKREMIADSIRYDTLEDYYKNFFSIVRSL